MRGLLKGRRSTRGARHGRACRGRRGARAGRCGDAAGEAGCRCASRSAARSRRPRAASAGAAQPHSQRHGCTRRDEARGSARHCDRAARRRGSDREIAVGDAGHGIPPTAGADLRPVLHDQAERHGHGASISRTIVEAHGGRFWAENRTAAARRFVSRCPSRRRAPPYERARTHRPHRRRRCALSGGGLAAASRERVCGQDVRVSERLSRAARPRMRRAACSPMCGCPA